MEILAIITGSLGAIFGGYGAWRSWRTDRAQKILGKKWDIEHRNDIEFLFFNRQPRNVYGVNFNLPDGFVLDPIDIPAVIRPNESARVVIVWEWFTGQEQLEVTWHHRPDLSDDPLIWRGRLPGGYGGVSKPQKTP